MNYYNFSEELDDENYYPQPQTKGICQVFTGRCLKKQFLNVESITYKGDSFLLEGLSCNKRISLFCLVLNQKASVEHACADG